MSSDHRLSLQREGLLFFGAMGAGLSHEVNNVFNIINELSGLQQDIVKANAHGGAAGLARVADLAARIKSQVTRGEEINHCLHHLSHSADNDDTTFDLGETLALFGSLISRAARLAEVELTVRPFPSPIAHRGDPFALLLVLHGFVMTAFKAAASERRVEVWVEEESGSIRVVVSSADPLPDLETDTPEAASIETGCAALAALVRCERATDAPHRMTAEFQSGSPNVMPGDDNVRVED